MRLRLEVALVVLLPACRSPEARPAVPESRATLLYTVGAAGGSVELGEIRSLLLDPQGGLYVVDPSHKTLTRFDSTGRLVRQFGREGAGPGEYRRPYSIAWLEGRLALLDPGNVRLTLYDSAGGWVASWPVQPITGGQVIRLYRTPPDFWAYGIRRVDNRSETVFIHYSATGPVDTLPVLRPPEGFAQGRMCNRPDKAITFFDQPFGPTFIVIPAPGGLRAVVTTSAYRIALLDRQGDTVRVIERSAATAPITDAEWEAANEEWRKFRAEWPTASCDRADFSRPAAKPPLAHLFYDDGGRLWVELIAPDGPRYDVFGPDGRLELTVTGLPASGGRDPSVAGDRIALAGEDSTGVPVVRVFRIAASLH